MRLLFKILNVAALLVLLLSCMAQYVPPEKIWQLSFIGFGFPVVLLINAGFAVLWLLKRDFFGLLPLAAIIFSWPFIQSTFAFNYTVQQKETGIKVMTWNVKNFDFYNWSKRAETRDEMLKLIKKTSPDILCIQEFYTDDTWFKNLEYLRDTLGYNYVHFAPAIEAHKPIKAKIHRLIYKKSEVFRQWGLATFSRFPIVNKGEMDFDSRSINDCIFTDVQVNGSVWRLYNVHFQSLHLGYDDYAVVDSMTHINTFNWQQTKSILRKMKKAYALRSEQARAVARHMEAHNGIDLVCGDFNDVPVSYTYRTTRSSLTDPFTQLGYGFGSTFANRLSIFRIDYILADERLPAVAYQSIPQKLSDHYPVYVNFEP